MSIEIENITKCFGKTTALNQVNLTFEKGKICGLLGNNGAGKTTLFRLIANHIFPSEGTIRVDGEEVWDNDRVLGKMFLVSEGNLYPESMKVKDGFRSAGIFYPGFDLENANRLAELFHLPLKKKIAGLSTGYKTIYKLVLGLSVNTPYLLLDEPVLGLDASHRELFYKLLIEKIAESPCTVLLSTHLIQEAAPLVEQTIIIEEGKILRNRPKDDLLEEYCLITGPSSKLEEWLPGKKIVKKASLGGLASVYIEGTVEEADLPQGFTKEKLSLQEYFILLTNGGIAS
jgi:ABC-2 type transport system ATP-binding protein